MNLKTNTRAFKLFFLAAILLTFSAVQAYAIISNKNSNEELVTQDAAICSGYHCVNAITPNSGPTEGGQTVTITGDGLSLAKGRYMRACTNGSNHNKSNHITEMQAFSNGVNVALGRAATSANVIYDPAIYTEDGHNSKSILTDGDISSGNYFAFSYWTGGATYEYSYACVTLDLGQSYEIDTANAVYYFGNSGRIYYDMTLSFGDYNDPGKYPVSQLSEGRQTAFNYTADLEYVVYRFPGMTGPTTTSSGYAPEFSATIDGSPCTDLTMVSSTQFQCKTPEHIAGGPYDLDVNFTGRHVVKQNAFTYKDLTLSSISPNAGPQAGGARITIHGQNFPYVNPADYIQDGIVGQWDAIDNIGLGDKYHSNNTSSWVDLTGKGHDCTLLQNSYDWNERKLIPRAGGSNGDCGWKPDLDIADRVTMEATLSKITGSSNETLFGRNHLTSYYMNSGYNPTSDITIHINGGNIASEQFIPAQTLVTAASTFDVARTGKTVEIYGSGILKKTGNITTGLPSRAGSKMHLCIADGSICDSGGGSALRSNLFAYRLYNRALSGAEIAYNSALDQVRFLDPPTVSIGGISCVDVVVLSSETIECTTGNGTSIAETAQNVLVNFSGSEYSIVNGYTYYNTSHSYVTSTSPKFSAAISGAQLTVVGNFTGTPDNATVKIGNQICTKITYISSQLSCSIPLSLIPGDYDITVVSDGTTIVVPAGIKILAATKYPIEFHIENATNGVKIVIDSIEDEWVGISKVTLSAPSGLTLSTINSAWQKSDISDEGGVKTYEFASTTPASSQSVHDLINELTLTGTSPESSKISLSLTNSIW
ncbi:MAG: IPT/TIG domain-containing protein [Bifidobacteriaceae bacterium]|jgi:hypothetical protein|nr:IPT/TIG domain-containing protein [Bifidobacteriaceae bacterium]